MKEPPKQYIGSCLEVLNPEPQTSKHVILTNLHFSIGIIMKASILGGCVVGSRMIASAIFWGSHMRFVQCIKFSLELWFTIRMIHIYISLSLSPSPSLPLSLSLSLALSPQSPSWKQLRHLSGLRITLVRLMVKQGLAQGFYGLPALRLRGCSISRLQCGYFWCNSHARQSLEAYVKLALW